MGNWTAALYLVVKLFLLTFVLNWTPFSKWLLRFATALLT